MIKQENGLAAVGQRVAAQPLVFNPADDVAAVNFNQDPVAVKIQWHECKFLSEGKNDVGILVGRSTQVQFLPSIVARAEAECRVMNPILTSIRTHKRCRVLIVGGIPQVIDFPPSVLRRRQAEEVFYTSIPFG